MRISLTDLPSNNSIFCLTSNWSIAARYSKPGGQSAGGGGPIPNICWGLSKKSWSERFCELKPIQSYQGCQQFTVLAQFLLTLKPSNKFYCIFASSVYTHFEYFEEKQTQKSHDPYFYFKWIQR